MRRAGPLRRAGRGVREYSPAEVEALLFVPDAVVIDIRDDADAQREGLIAGAIRVPDALLESWAGQAGSSRWDPIDRQRRTILFCSGGGQSRLAARRLSALGFEDVGHLRGGLVAWRRAGNAIAGLGSWHQGEAP